MKYGARIHRGLLLKALGFKQKIPAEFEGTFKDVECRSKWPEGIVCTTTVVVFRTERSMRSDGRWYKTSTHRIYVECPRCGRMIPFGRLHQHLDTGGCKR